MNLHEYQSKQLFAQYGLPVSKGFACATADEVAEKIKEISGDKWV
ncbi:MAG: ATP-grasp domain-containing protein, partial [Alcanivoracaceae bacterium]